MTAHCSSVQPGQTGVLYLGDGLHRDARMFLQLYMRQHFWHGALSSVVPANAENLPGPASHRGSKAPLPLAPAVLEMMVASRYG